MPRAAKKTTATTERLGRDDWTKSALSAIAEKGTAHVSVERLARELGATKGSFYWHFKDRTALIEAALERWEARYTDRIIDRLSPIPDPRERFRKLLESTFDDHPEVLIDANLLAAAGDPAVGPALERVARKRLTFIEQVFADLDATDGPDRAILALSAYVGLAQLRRTAPGLAPHGPGTKAYIEHAITWLLGD